MIDLEKQIFLQNQSWQVFKTYFENNESFLEKVYEITTSKEQRVFLETTSRYFNLVKELRCINSTVDVLDPDWISDTYKFNAIIALIESLAPYEKYIDFHDWLIKQNDFPLNKGQVEDAYSKYKEIYGSRKSIMDFFQKLDVDAQNFLRKSILILPASNNEGENFLTHSTQIDEISRILYEIRNDFIHKAKYVNEFSDISTFSKRKKKYLCFKISIEHFCIIFEIGLLKHFGIAPDKPPIFNFYDGFEVVN
jgi:hypothetical protein